MSSPDPRIADVPRLFPPAQKPRNKFLNTVPTVTMRRGSTWHTLRRFVTDKPHTQPGRPLGPFCTNSTLYSSTPASALRVTWFGHSTSLLEMDGHRILTDPVWSNRASFVSFAGPKRFYPPPLPLEKLPPLNAVVVSHDHYDHLDRYAVAQLATSPVQGKTRWICSLGVGLYLKQWGVPPDRITEMNWGETFAINRDLHITATPARHFSGRSLWNRNETLWSSFILQTNRRKIFFSGDSGLFPGFGKIGELYGPFELTMLEIGAYDVDWPDIHMGPEKALEAHIALRGQLLLPIHWGLFNLAFHPWSEPVERLVESATRKDIPLILPKPGHPTEITGTSLNTNWWKP